MVKAKQNADQFKKDMTLMEYPLFFLSDKHFKEVELKKGKTPYLAKVWTSGDYWFEAVAGIPNEWDYIILAYLLKQSQKSGWSPTLEVSVRDILVGCGINPGTSWYYERVETTLEVWERVRFHFENDSFRYKTLDKDGHRYITKWKALHTGIISNWGKLSASKGKKIYLTVTLDNEFLNIMKSSMFYKSVDFQDLRRLRREPTAVRLHEILLKSFEKEPFWEIGVKKLAVKMTIPDIYPSRIRKKIESAVKVINDKTSRQFAVEYMDKKSGYKIPKFRFTVVTKSQKPVTSPAPSKQANYFFDAQLPFDFGICENERPEVSELVSYFFDFMRAAIPAKAPADTKENRKKGYDIILEIEQEGNTIDHIRDVLVFGVRDPFWEKRFFSLAILQDSSENGNTFFQNMSNAYQGIKNPSCKPTPLNGCEGSRMQKNAGAVSSFLSEEDN